jgi:transcriptional regulator with XRE-family HTH domain
MPLSFGAELRARRLATGVSLTRFAHSINYSKSHISKIENGAKVPGTLLARLCDAALGADGQLAALAGGAPSRRPANRGPWAPVISTWPLVTKAGPAEVLDAFRAQFDTIRRLTQTLSAAVLLPMLITETRAVHMVAATAGATARSRLFLLAARYAELTGWMTQETGDDTGALWWTNLAVGYAAEGGDRQLAAFAGVRRADIAMYQRNSAETIALARYVQRIDCGGRIRALAAQREAQGHAIAGDYDACLRALDQAAYWFARSEERDGEPVLGSSTIRDPIDMAIGWCLHDLGWPHEAARRLAGQLDGTPGWAGRTRGRLGARYALALLAGGDIEPGCAALRRALDDCAGLGSATIRSDLREVARHLHRHPTHPSARAVLPRLTEALAG